MMLWMRRMKTLRQPSNKKKKKKTVLVLIVTGARIFNPASMSEDEEGDDANEKLVDEEKDTNTANEMKHGYRLSLQ
jgi:hypothetical protein